MVTPREAARLIADEQDIEARKLRFAREMDEAKEEIFLKRNLKGQMEAVLRPNSGLLPTVLALSAYEKKQYSVVKLLQSQATESKEMRSNAKFLTLSKKTSAEWRAMAACSFSCEFLPPATQNRMPPADFSLLHELVTFSTR